MRRLRACLAHTRPGGWGHRPGQLRGSAVRGWTRSGRRRRKPSGSGVEYLPRPHPEVRSPRPKSPQWSAARRCASGRPSLRTRCRKRNEHKVRLAALHAPRFEGANEAGLARAVRGAGLHAHLAQCARINSRGCLKIESEFEVAHARSPLRENDAIIAAFAGTTSGNPQKNSSGHGSTICQRSVPFLIFFISLVRPPLRLIHDFTV